MPTIRYNPSQFNRIGKTPHVARLVPQGSGSMLGGGFYGILNSFSMQGGGSFGSLASQSMVGGGVYGTDVGGIVTGVTWRLGQDTSTIDPVGLFVKFASNPASDMIMLDMNAGVTGLLRFILQSNGKLRTECQLQGIPLLSVVSLDAIVLGSWNWLTGAAWVNHSAVRINVSSQIYQPSGTTSGLATAQDPSVTASGDVDYTMQISIGVNLTGSFLIIPNSAGWQWSKEIWQTPGLASERVTPPSADWASGSTIGFYNCRQTPGAVSSVTDGSGSGHDLSAGAQGLTCLADGPFAS